MNEDKKLKDAFKKVKQDMFILSKQIDDLRTGKGVLKPETKSDFDKKKFDNFVTNVEKELGDLNLYLKEFDDRIEHITKQLEITEQEREQIKLKSLANQNKAQSNKLDLELSERRFEEFSEILNEKISLEISATRLEFTEEIANLYDKFFNEILDLKHEITKKVKNDEKETSKKSEIKKESKKQTINTIPAPLERDKNLFSKKNSKKKEDSLKKIEDDELYPAPNGKESKMKKIAKWLFVDEEEDEMEDIKSEVKNNK